ncbi:transcriptional regulator [Streptomyces lydicus]|nr:transcriptional regulator [Streptomyces lydicus]
MERRSLLALGVGLGAVALAGRPTPTEAAAKLSAGDVAAGRRLFAAGAYKQLDEVLPLLLATAARSTDQGPASAARAADVWALASQLAVKHGRTEAAGAYAQRAGAAARRSGDPVVLALAARAAATPLRRTGHTGEALHLLTEARAHLTTSSRPTPAELEAAGMAALTAAYTAALAHLPTTACDFAAQAEESTHRLTRHPHPAGTWELTADQCALYRIGIHRHLGEVDAALAAARRLRPEHLPTAERRARAATDTARALLAARRCGRRLRPAAPGRGRRAAGGQPPSVCALTARVAGLRPGLPGLSDYARRTTVSLL